MCGPTIWSLVLIIQSGVLSGRPDIQTILTDLPSRAACEAAKADAGLIELRGKAVCIEQMR